MPAGKTAWGDQAQAEEGNPMTVLKKLSLLFSAVVCLGVICSAQTTLRVQVLDAKTDAPVQASVSAIGMLPRLESARTNEQGVAVLDLPWLEQVFAIVKTSTHGEKCLGEEETKEGIVVARMVPSLRIFGVVRDPSGNPLRQASVKLLYKDDPKCRIRFERPDEATNERGEYVLRNVDLTRDPTIVVRHDRYAERDFRSGEISAAPSDPSAKTKELDVNLSERF
jgi:hypothetical protein